MGGFFVLTAGGCVSYHGGVPERSKFEDASPLSEAFDENKERAVRRPTRVLKDFFENEFLFSTSQEVL